MKNLLLALIHLYQRWLSPVFGRSCRFHPTCSHYTAECIECHGSFWGIVLGTYRILRCNPFCRGGMDPVPASKPRFARHVLTVFGVFAAVILLNADNAVNADALPTTGSVNAKLVSKEYEAVVNEVGGGSLIALNLRERQFQKNGQPVNVVSTTKPSFQPLQVFVDGIGMPENALWQKDIVPSNAEGSANKSIAYEWTGNGVRVARKLETGRTPYTIWSTVQVTNQSANVQNVRVSLSDFHYVRRAEEKGGFLASPAHGVSHGLCGSGDKLERITRDDIQSGKAIGAGKVQIAGIENVYFVKALAAEGTPLESCKFRSSDRGGTPDSPDGSLIEGIFRYPKIALSPNQSYTVRTLFYVGPKKPAQLHQAGHGLQQVVDLGFFSAIAGSLVKLLAYIHRYIPNWGLAIILLTVLVKGVLYPLTERSFRSMARMRQLKPELDRINELYADNREKKGAATMELYRKNGINPMGGCLPQLLQLPIWWALYTSLSTNVELYNAPFMLWWKDLSSPDPFYTLPLMLGGLMVVQQKLTPSTMDPAQAKVMAVMMPVMITAFMLFLPAGLCVYMVTNSVLGIAQQKFIEWRMGNSTSTGATTDGRMERGRA